VVEISIPTLKSYKSPGIYQIPAELIQAGGGILQSEFHKTLKKNSEVLVCKRTIPTACVV
jgi:hypothetical protein